MILVMTTLLPIYVVAVRRDHLEALRPLHRRRSRPSSNIFMLLTVLYFGMATSHDHDTALETSH